ncbi:ABC transporter ATP-binding protein [Hanstruepera ponticola]|uniref:ABC transporter ATP-binding protein n=1 Tax=Hanstruepera ponticola TaxID=2042995 RepID=UPI00178657DD|nr:ABC transporter ATP-binding protein [Hanstruepera ponticola]
MVILKAEHISKQYRLGLVGTGTISHDLNRWWYRVRGKEDPYLKVGSVNDRSAKADSDYVWALQDINFEVHKGEVLGIIGKNGAGKSTLLKILSRVTSPTTGDIKTKGRIASLLEVGTGFHPELTGRENIYLNGAILGMTKSEIKAKESEIIAFSGCERYVDTPVKRYSSGMRVRLAFAVAAHLEPDILVVDEVLAVGDAEFQKKAVGKMQDISKGDGRTVLFVSHNMAAVKSLCTRAMVLEHGTTVFEGNTDEAVDYYLQINSQNNSYQFINDNQIKESDILEIVVKKEGIPSNVFSFSDAIDIEFKLKVASNDLKARLGFKVIDKSERIVFSTNINLIDYIDSEGVYVFKVTIPSLLLSPNNYNITVGYHVFKKYIIRKLDNIVNFSIEETGTKFQNHFNDDIGCVIIDCDWRLIN